MWATSFFLLSKGDFVLKLGRGYCTSAMAFCFDLSHDSCRLVSAGIVRVLAVVVVLLLLLLLLVICSIFMVLLLVL